MIETKRKTTMSSLKSQEVEDVLVVYFTDAKILDEARIQQIGKELMEMAAASQSKKAGAQLPGRPVHVVRHDRQAGPC